MVVDEQARQALHQRLEVVLGAGEAGTLMDYLPKASGGDLAARADLRHELDGLEGRLDVRFQAIDTRLDTMDTRFDAMDTRFDGMDTRFDGMDTRFDVMDTRFDAMDTRFERLEAHFTGFDYRFEGLAARIGESEHRVLGTVRKEMMNQTRTFVISMVATVVSLSGAFLGVVAGFT